MVETPSKPSARIRLGYSVEKAELIDAAPTSIAEATSYIFMRVTSLI